MPAAADKKRKKADSAKNTPAKKRKVDASPKKSPKKAGTTPKKIAVKSKKDTSVSKAKKSSKKGNKTKEANKGKKAKPVAKKETKKSAPAKKIVKSKPASKPTKPNKTNSKPTKPAKANSKPKPVSKKEVKKSAQGRPVVKSKQSQKAIDKTKKADAKPNKLAVKSVTRAKLESAKAKTAQAKLAQAKLKAAKRLAKLKEQRKKTVVSKPKEDKKSDQKIKQDKKATRKPAEKSKSSDKKTNATKISNKKVPEKAAENLSAAEAKKRKSTEPEAAETPRKKRVITPNKRYADFETDTSPKRISELRAFVQDKKKTPASAKDEQVTKNPRSTTKQDSTPVKTLKPGSEETQQSPQIKVIKASEMKPAEKLLKKLQKKLEKEAKAALIKPKQSPNKDPARTKITKVVTYNKPAYTKTATKTLFPKAKTKPAVMVKKKSPTAIAEKEEKLKVTPKVVHSPKKIKEQKKDERKIQAKFVFQKNVRQADDASTTCWVTGIDVFKSGEVVLVDMANKKIKLFTSAFEYMSQAKLDTTPQDISISPVDASVAYFTKPFSKEGIQKVCLSDGTLTLKDSFLTNGTNRGIKCIKSGILTSVQNGRYHDLDINCFKIELLDYKGNLIQSVSMDQNGVRLFKLPLYFTVNNMGKQIIVSDCIRNNSYILSLDMTGKIKFKFTGVRDIPITPRGLTTDDENNIYVTEWERHNVYILTPTGKRLQLLLEHTEQLKEGQDGLKKPYQLCYYRHEDAGRLIVSQESCNTIKVYEISQRQPDQNGSSTESSAANAKTTPAGTATPTKVTNQASTKNTPSKPTATTQLAVQKSPAKANIIEVKTATPAVLTIPAGTSVPPAAASILSQEHAYTTLAAPEQKQTETMVRAMDTASDTVEEENPEEISSLVDSIICDLNSRESQGVASMTEVVVQDPVL